MMRRMLAVTLLVLAAPFAHAQSPMNAAPAPAPGARGVHFIYLVRHGMYTPDTVNTDDRVSSALNTLGHEQARFVGKRLAKLPVKFHALVTSDFTRARETADEMGRILRMTPVRDSLIHECTPRAENPAWMKNAHEDEIVLCESNLAAAWAKYVVPTPNADTHDVLVCHGNVIRWMIAKTIADDPTHCSRMDIGNCSLTIIAVRPDGVARLVMYSDVGHLPLDKQTWTGRGAGWKK